MSRAPRLLALPLTFLVGRPATGQRPVRLTPTAHLVGAGISLLAGVTITAGALSTAGWWLALVPLGWAVTLHGMRNLRMMIFHQCAHRNMWGRPRADRALGRFIAALLMIQNFERYSLEHVSDHHAVHHMTLKDPTVQAFLISLRLLPGMSRRDMWHRLLGRLFSPLFHARFLLARVRSNLYPASVGVRIGTVTAYILTAAVVTYLDAWLLLLVAWVLPLTVFYQISNTLRLCVKHSFPDPGLTERRGRAYFASLTNAIFLGERAPDPGLPPLRRRLAWSRWWLRMAVVHLPARYLVLTGDTVCHDYHHRYPMSRNWANYIFARSVDEADGHPGWPPYRAAWGLVPAMNLVFDSLSRADTTEFDPRRLATVSQRNLYDAFDD